MFMTKSIEFAWTASKMLILNDLRIEQLNLKESMNSWIMNNSILVGFKLYLL